MNNYNDLPKDVLDKIIAEFIKNNREWIHTQWLLVREINEK